jgi:RecJ-like exonuclease
VSEPVCTCDQKGAVYGANPEGHRSGCAKLRALAGAVSEWSSDDSERVRRLILDALIEGNGTHDCPACDCTGVLRDKRTCPLCDGWGYL